MGGCEKSTKKFYLNLTNFNSQVNCPQTTRNSGNGHFVENLLWVADRGPGRMRSKVMRWNILHNEASHSGNRNPLNRFTLQIF